MSKDIPQLSRARAEELLREAVAERGADYIYSKSEGSDGPFSSCLYVHKDAAGNPRPGCGVGVVLHKAGVTLGSLAEEEGLSAMQVLGSMRVKGILDADPFATELLLVFQGWQDTGWPWGQALTLSLHGVKNPTAIRYSPERSA